MLYRYVRTYTPYIVRVKRTIRVYIFISVSHVTPGRAAIIIIIIIIIIPTGAGGV